MMGFLSAAYKALDTSPTSDFWYNTIGGVSQVGMRITPITALESSAVWACARLISETLAVMRIQMRRRRSDGGSDEATEHPLWDLLHDAPNPTLTAYTWKRLTMVHALLWGNAYSRIMPGPRGPIDELWPLHPDQVSVEAQDAGGIWRGIDPTTPRTLSVRRPIRYQVRESDNTSITLNDDEVFHLPGLTLNGTLGLGLMQYARDSVGMALAAKSYSARFYGQGARPDGIISYPSGMKVDAKNAMMAAWKESHQGLANAHQVAAMPADVKWVPTGMTNEDAQLVEQLNWSTEDIARFFNVPLHMIQAMQKSTSWGSGLEEMSTGFIVHTMLPWMTNWEDTISKDLIVARRLYYAKLNAKALLRGREVERYQSYATARQWGWLSVNDIRRLEDQNPIEGGDEYLRPLNMVDVNAPPPAPEPAAPQPRQSPAGDDEDGAVAPTGHYLSLLHETAARVVRREVAALGKIDKRCDGKQRAAEIAAFYAEHARYVSEALQIGLVPVSEWCNQQRLAAINAPAEIAEWETTRTGALVALALGEKLWMN